MIGEAERPEARLTITEESEKQMLEQLTKIAQALLTERDKLESDVETVGRLVRGVRRALRELGGHANMSMHLLTDMIDFAQFKSNAFALRNDYFDLGKLVKESFRMVEQQARSAKVALRGPLFDDESHTPFFTRFFGDEFRYKQVLVNFISNAIKFTPADGSIFVQLAIIGVTEATKEEE